MALDQNGKKSLNHTNRSSMARKLPPAPVEYLPRQSPPFRRDMEAARNGFAEEFPLLCANFGVSFIPQVMIVDPETNQLTPLPLKSRKEIVIEKITPVQTWRGANSKDSLLTETHADSQITNYIKSIIVPVLSPYVVVSFHDLASQEGLNKFMMKGFPVDEAFINALGIILKWYHDIHVLILENCYMTAAQVELLAKYMADSQVIVDLKLDGNPIPQQNYSSLLHANTGLQHLSLAYCKIDDLGAERIAKELAYRPPPWKDTIVSLNLQGNQIGDKGMESIANALRTNRSLRVIKLPRNTISDTGAMALASALQKFPLSSEDVKNRLSESHLKYSEFRRNGTTHRETVKNIPAPSHLKKIKSDQASRLEYPGAETKRKKVEYKYHHPYVWDVRPEGLDLWCIGNFNLEEIDLSHNEIGVKGAKKFVEVIEYQATFKEGEFKHIKGLTNIKLQGNRIPKNSYELNRIDELLSIALREKYPPKRRSLKPPVMPQISVKSSKKHSCSKSPSRISAVENASTGQSDKAV